MIKPKNINLALCVFILLSQYVSISTADTITSNDGTKLTCVIILEDAKTMVVETRFGSMSLHRKAIRNIERDTNEKNLLLRGEFSIARNDFNTAMKYYQEAMMLYPSSIEVRERYRQLRDAMDKSSQKELFDYGKKDEQNKEITDENREVAEKHIKNKKNEPITTLILYGFGSYPTGKEYSRSIKEVVEIAKLDALKKAFGDAVGTGFVISKGKLKILPPGELPNYRMKILEKHKVENLGYSVKLQVQCPPSSLLFKLPDEVIEQEATGSVTIDVKKKQNYRITALEEACRQAVLNTIAISPQYQNKPELAGRIFLIEPPIENKVAGIFQVKIRVKIWFDI
jgi:hypothetical protein